MRRREILSRPWEVVRGRLPPLRRRRPTLGAMSSRLYASKTYKINRALILGGNPRCAICGELGADTADHIVPISRGGSNAIGNLRPAHQRCNSLRGARVKMVYRARW